MALNDPSLDVLMGYADNRYTLVIISAKRARQVTERFTQEEEKESIPEFDKSVSSALQEVASGSVTFERTTQGIK